MHISHHFVVPLARISLTLSRYFFLSFIASGRVLAGLQGYILYPPIAAECMFLLVVLLLPGHMWGSIGLYHMIILRCIIFFLSIYIIIIIIMQ